MLSGGLQRGALGEPDQLIHGPLVESMGSVFHRLDLSGRIDQEVAWKPKGTSRWAQAKMPMRHPAHAGAQGFEGHEPERYSNAEVFVERLLRIANQQEWKILLVRPDRLRRGMKDDHLFDARRFDVASTLAQLGDMRVANRTVHEP